MAEGASGAPIKSTMPRTFARTRSWACVATREEAAPSRYPPLCNKFKPITVSCTEQATFDRSKIRRLQQRESEFNRPRSTADEVGTGKGKRSRWRAAMASKDAQWKQAPWAYFLLDFESWPRNSRDFTMLFINSELRATSLLTYSNNSGLTISTEVRDVPAKASCSS